MPPSESGGSGGTRLTLSKRFAQSKNSLPVRLKGHSRTLAQRSVSRSDQDRPELAEKEGDEPRSAAPSQRGYCVIVPDTVAGAFACSTAQSRA